MLPSSLLIAVKMVSVPDTVPAPEENPVRALPVTTVAVMAVAITSTVAFLLAGVPPGSETAGKMSVLTNVVADVNPVILVSATYASRIMLPLESSSRNLSNKVSKSK